MPAFVALHHGDRAAHWYERPAWLAVLVLGCTLALNVVFF